MINKFNYWCVVKRVDSLQTSQFLLGASVTQSFVGNVEILEGFWFLGFLNLFAETNFSLFVNTIIDLTSGSLIFAKI